MCSKHKTHIMTKVPQPPIHQREAERAALMPFNKLQENKNRVLSKQHRILCIDAPCALHTKTYAYIISWESCMLLKLQNLLLMPSGHGPGNSALAVSARASVAPDNLQRWLPTSTILCCSDRQWQITFGERSMKNLEILLNS